MLTKEEIIQIKAKEGNLISYESSITGLNVYKAFYGSKEDKSSLGITYFCQSIYEVSRGDFNCGIKYSFNEETYYMFVGANTGYAPAQSIAVGKAQNGKIYLIWENFPNNSWHMQLRIIDEEYTLKNAPGYRPASYYKEISSYKGHLKGRIKEIKEAISDEDVKCVLIALEGVVAFSDLIENILPDTRKPKASAAGLKLVP